MKQNSNAIKQSIYLAISSANLIAIVGFSAPLLFRNARRSPCKTYKTN